LLDSQKFEGIIEQFMENIKADEPLSQKLTDHVEDLKCRLMGIF